MQNGMGILQDGKKIDEVIPHLSGARFIGINCISAHDLAGQIKHLRGLVSNDVQISAYGNVGYATEDGLWVNTDAVEPEVYAGLVNDWIEAGANIVGGCCGTVPATIKGI
jgi:S-methylmethionine-dependent homocysteine/selenocysteine methylase